VRGTGGFRRGAQRRLAARPPLGFDARHGARPGRVSGGAHDLSGARSLAHRPARRSHAAHARHRNAGRGDRPLRGQDRHADGKPHDSVRRHRGRRNARIRSPGRRHGERARPVRPHGASHSLGGRRRRKRGTPTVEPAREPSVGRRLFRRLPDLDPPRRHAPCLRERRGGDRAGALCRGRRNAPSHARRRGGFDAARVASSRRRGSGRARRAARVAARPCLAMAGTRCVLRSVAQGSARSRRAVPPGGHPRRDDYRRPSGYRARHRNTSGHSFRRRGNDRLGSRPVRRRRVGR
jgi:hypothetical protein